MAFTYIRHKLHLHRKKIVFAVFSALLLSGSMASAQKKISQENKANYDEKRVHYGFYLALPLTKFNLEHSREYTDQLDSGSPMTVNARSTPGFYTGLVLNVGLAEYLDFRFVPGVGFYGRQIEYANATQDDGTRGTTNVTISSTMVELPFLLQYKSKRRTNYRMYFVGGLKPGIDLNSEKDNNSGDGLRTEKFDLALEYGVGVDIFYPFFKFAPELRFSHGLLNQHIRDNNVYSRSIQRLTNHNISLILFFE